MLNQAHFADENERKPVCQKASVKSLLWASWAADTICNSYLFGPWLLWRKETTVTPATPSVHMRLCQMNNYTWFWQFTNFLSPTGINRTKTSDGRFFFKALMKNRDVCSLDELGTQNLAPPDCCLSDSSVSPVQSALSECACVYVWSVSTCATWFWSHWVQSCKRGGPKHGTGRQLPWRSAQGPKVLESHPHNPSCSTSLAMNHLKGYKQQHDPERRVAPSGQVHPPARRKCHETANVFTGGGGIDRLDFYGPM